MWRNENGSEKLRHSRGDALSVSIVVEWDNARHSELDRARAMYRQLMAQIGELRTPPPAAYGDQRDPSPGPPGSRYEPNEVLIVYNALEVDPSVISIVTCDPACQLPVGTKLRLVDTAGLGYYQLKNEGAKLSSGDLLVFVDSDVIPEPRWLGELLRAFDNPDVQVVAGNSHIHMGSLYGRTFARMWFFPERAADGPLQEANEFFANNVAFRRQVFERHRFPDEPRFRGQCQTLAKTLLHEGISIHHNPCARAEHPAPNGVSHFLRRALCEGHDLAVGERLLGEAGRPGLRASGWRFRSKLIRSWEVIRRERERGGFTAIGVAVAFGLALTYYVTVFLGEFLTRLDPRIIRRFFPI